MHLPDSTKRKDILSRLKRFVLAIDTTPERRYAHWVTLLDNPTKIRLYTPDFQAQMVAVDVLTLVEQVQSISIQFHTGAMGERRLLYQ